MIIDSQNTQVSPYRDLFKGCNKAPGAAAKGLSTHSSPGFNNAAVHIAQTVVWRADGASQPRSALKTHTSNLRTSDRLYVTGDNVVSLHRGDEFYVCQSCVWLLTPTLSTVTNAKNVLSQEKKRRSSHSLLNICSSSASGFSRVLIFRCTLQLTEGLGTRECWATYNEFVYQAAPRIDGRNVYSQRKERGKVRETERRSRGVETIPVVWATTPPTCTDAAI